MAATTAGTVRIISDPLGDFGRNLDRRWRPRRQLNHREFAEKYVRLATGPYRGLPFRVHRQPFTGLLFDEMDSRRWPTIFVTGPSQSSKTLSAFVIPALRDWAELRVDNILGVPEGDMASDKWEKDFLPTLEASPDLRHLIPTRGPGSRGGSIRDRITLGNGVDAKIITRGGQDTAKAGYTAPHVRVTEAAGWSTASEASSEANPLRQLIARMRAFRRSERSLIVEGTTTVADELPWRARGDDDDERLISTQSTLQGPCPHCEAFIAPERQHLVGWQQAQTEQEAVDRAAWMCPECQNLISDKQRRTLHQDLRLVHYGQLVDAQGNVIGEPPPTSTLWFRWTAFNNCLLDAADVAVDEWKAAQIEDGTLERDNAERELCQFCHALPHRSLLAEDEPLNATPVRKRFTELPRNVLPADTQAWTIGVDIGKWSSHWAAVALRETGELYVPAYGIFSVVRDNSDEVEERVLHSLLQFRDEVCEAGLPQEGSDGTLLPNLVGVDIGYLPDVIADFVRRSGRLRANRYRGLRGRGASVRQGQGFTPLKKRTEMKPVSGTQWWGELNHERRVLEITFDADFWKLMVHERVKTKVGRPGSLAFYRADTPNEHARISNHIANEQLRFTWQPDKGRVGKWVKTGENHFLDALAMAMVMLDMAAPGKAFTRRSSDGQGEAEAQDK